MIDRHPAVVSTVLAAEMGVDRPVFKLDIRKLKESGLTESLEVGYRLSPRGKRLLSYLRKLTGRNDFPPISHYFTAFSRSTRPTPNFPV